MGVTLYLNGAFAAWKGGFKIKNALGGTLTPSGQKVIKVPWPGEWGTISNNAADEGVTNLYNAIIANLSVATTGDPLIIAGHSGGAQTIQKMLRERGANLLAALSAAGKTSAVLRFYLLGTPEAKFIGASYLYTATDPPKYPGDPTKGGVAHSGSCPTPAGWHGGYGIGYGLPEPCPWRVDVVAMQYDGWAMAPTTPSQSDVAAVWKTGIPGMLLATKSGSGPHGDYDKKGAVSLSHADAFGWTDAANSTVKYWVIRRYPFPGFEKISWFRFLVRNRDMTRRPAVDAAYAATSSTQGLQVTIPAPDYSIVPTWFPLD